jgi:deazaflavin-dependent oxidoreductase (nitroreductase family)
MTRATGRLPAWLPFVNWLTRGLTRLGIRVGPVCVLTVPGRRSGVPRPAPVTPITVDGRRYVIAGLPRGDWARNVRAAGRGELASGRRRGPVLLTEVTDPALRRRVVRAFPAEAPGGVFFYVRLGLVTSGDPDEFEAAADQVAVFEITPA